MKLLSEGGRATAENSFWRGKEAKMMMVRTIKTCRVLPEENSDDTDANWHPTWCPCFFIRDNISVSARVKALPKNMSVLTGFAWAMCPQGAVYTRK
jgi:hypothetical protein